MWRVDDNGARTLPGEIAFKLYDTFGFPLDLTEVIGHERSFTVDTAGFKEAMELQKARSEGSKVGEASIEAVWRVALERVPNGAVRFTGYEHEEGEGKVVALVKGGALVNELVEGDNGSIVVDATPFYGEAGGQSGDRGTISLVDATFEVEDTQKPSPASSSIRAS